MVAMPKPAPLMKPITLILILAASVTLLSQEVSRTNRQVSNTEQTTNSLRSGEAASRPAVPATLRQIASQVTVADPVSHANLEIFLIEGDDWGDTTQILTLDEAMSLKSGVVVKETGQVNELTVQNDHTDKEVFIMAGDIVKGGRQDRTLATDLPLQPKSGGVSVTSFCVEQGRWSKRGNESAAEFATSKNTIATKEGKLAVRKAANQSEVWKSVEVAQEKIGRNIGKDVKPAASASSLQLTLEDKDLKSKIKAFHDALQPVVTAHSRSLGFVCVINGEINSAEVFAGHDLFRRLWPKMLEGLATEAISLADDSKASKPAVAADVMAFIKSAEEVPAFKNTLQGSLQQVSAESDGTCLFETVDEKKNNQWLRRSILKKQPTKAK